MRNTAVPRGIPWKDRVELFCLGYENAADEAKNTDFSVFGWEYAYRGTEFLTYGLDKSSIRPSDILDWSIEIF